MYAVFHIAKAFDSERFSPEKRMSGTETQSYNDALLFAEVLASEHADNIHVLRNLLGYNYAACGNGRDKTGFVLRTSGGTDVFYTVKRWGE